MTTEQHADPVQGMQSNIENHKLVSDSRLVNAQTAGSSTSLGLTFQQKVMPVSGAAHTPPDMKNVMTTDSKVLLEQTSRPAHISAESFTVSGTLLLPEDQQNAHLHIPGRISKGQVLVPTHSVLGEVIVPEHATDATILVPPHSRPGQVHIPPHSERAVMNVGAYLQDVEVQIPAVDEIREVIVPAHDGTATVTLDMAGKTERIAGAILKCPRLEQTATFSVPACEERRAVTIPEFSTEVALPHMRGIMGQLTVPEHRYEGKYVIDAHSAKGTLLVEEHEMRENWKSTHYVTQAKIHIPKYSVAARLVVDGHDTAGRLIVPERSEPANVSLPASSQSVEVDMGAESREIRVIANERHTEAMIDVPEYTGVQQVTRFSTRQDVPISIPAETRPVLVSAPQFTQTAMLQLHPFQQTGSTTLTSASISSMSDQRSDDRFDQRSNVMVDSLPEEASRLEIHERELGYVQPTAIGSTSVEPDQMELDNRFSAPSPHAEESPVESIHDYESRQTPEIAPELPMPIITSMPTPEAQPSIQPGLGSELHQQQQSTPLSASRPPVSGTYPGSSSYFDEEEAAPTLRQAYVPHAKQQYDDNASRRETVPLMSHSTPSESIQNIGSTIEEPSSLGPFDARLVEPLRESLPESRSSVISQRTTGMPQTNLMSNTSVVLSPSRMMNRVDQPRGKSGFAPVQNLDQLETSTMDGPIAMNQNLNQYPPQVQPSSFVSPQASSTSTSTVHHDRVDLKPALLSPETKPRSPNDAKHVHFVEQPETIGVAAGDDQHMRGYPPSPQVSSKNSGVARNFDAAFMNQELMPLGAEISGLPEIVESQPEHETASPMQRTGFTGLQGQPSHGSFASPKGRILHQQEHPDTQRSISTMNSPFLPAPVAMGSSRSGPLASTLVDMPVELRTTKDVITNTTARTQPFHTVETTMIDSVDDQGRVSAHESVVRETDQLGNQVTTEQFVTETNEVIYEQVPTVPVRKEILVPAEYRDDLLHKPDHLEPKKQKMSFTQKLLTKFGAM